VEALSITLVSVVTRLIPTTVSWTRDSDDPDSWYFVKKNQTGDIFGPILVPNANAPNGEVNITFIQTG